MHGYGEIVLMPHNAIFPERNMKALLPGLHTRSHFFALAGAKRLRQPEKKTNVTTSPRGLGRSGPLAEGQSISVGAHFESRERISPDLKPRSTLDRPGGAKWRK
jgi:hypothetical protein